MDSGYQGAISGAYATRLIRRTAKKLIGSAGFLPADRQDLEQELSLDLWRRLSNFDPDRAQLQTFITRVVRHRAASLIQAQIAQMRDHRRTTRFVFDPADNDEPLGPKSFDHHAYLRLTDDQWRTDLAQRQLARDVAALLARLPPDLRDLCTRLAHRRPSEIARETRIPRSTLYASIAKLREHFKRAGLADYL